jgi:hypothetical protein
MDKTNHPFIFAKMSYLLLYVIFPAFRTGLGLNGVAINSTLFPPPTMGGRKFLTPNFQFRNSEIAGKNWAGLEKSRRKILVLFLNTDNYLISVLFLFKIPVFFSKNLILSCFKGREGKPKLTLSDSVLLFLLFGIKIQRSI